MHGVNNAVKYTLVFFLQIRKITETPSSGSRKTAGQDSLFQLARLCGCPAALYTPLTNVSGEYGQPLIGVKYPQSSVIQAGCNKCGQSETRAGKTGQILAHNCSVNLDPISFNQEYTGNISLRKVGVNSHHAVSKPRTLQSK
jgi:hypothetical protein